MRIVAGSFRGKRIDAPEGQGTRPTTDRVREALFSSLFSLRGGFEGARVLDAFAGSGALGLEALSRGAESCTFCERDAKAAAVLKRNVAACGLDAARAQVMVRDVLKMPPVSVPQPFDLVFLDPPYAWEPDASLRLAKGLLDAAALSPDALVVLEHALSAKDSVAAATEAFGFEPASAKKYGKTGIAIFRPVR